MPMTKSEMEDHYQQYHALMGQARASLREGLHRKAVQTALAAWDHIDGMMQYGRKCNDELFDTIAAVDLVLDYAPVLLDFRQLDRLEALLKEYRRVERDTTTDMGEQLARARARMWNAHRLWDHIEQHADARQAELRSALGGEQKEWVDIVTAWETMGLLRRIPEANTYRLAFSTRLGEVIPAKCPECGNATHAPKAMFLEEMACPACGKRVLFVLLGCEHAEA
jgi:hypothetical protein